MASYSELRSLFNDSDLMNRTQVACIIAAEAIRTENPATANHANRLIWAQRAFTSPTQVASQMLMAILSANKDATVAAIKSATDAVLQSNVDNAVDVFADGT